MADVPYSQRLAEFVSDFDAEAIPARVLERTRQSVLNALAAALSAAHADAVDKLVHLACTYAGTGSSALFGRTETVPILEAALVNGFMAHYNDYDDTHLDTVFHTNSPVVPPALLLASQRKLSGRALLTALALGLEGSMRFGQGMGPEHYDIGWHITGTAGTVGAALTCSRLLEHDARRTNFALGFALTQASGLRGQMFGTAAKGINAGTASMNGLLSALLADEGLDAAEDSIEGRVAYATAAAPKPRLERITEGLGESWVVPDVAFKPYASGVATHASIDAAVDLRTRLGLSPTSGREEVASAIQRLAVVNLTLPERYLHLPRPRDISAGLQAKFSVYNAVALAFTTGRVGPRDFSDAIATDPNVVAFRDKLNLVGDARPKDSATIQAQLQDGTTLECVVQHAVGSRDRPMSDGDIRAKLLDAGRDAFDRATLERLADLGEHLDQVDDVGEIVRLTTPAARR